jgi:hypothetical protein
MKCRVVNIKNSKYDIYIGRPSIWGNPYSTKENSLAKYKTKTRKESVEKYKQYILNNKELLSKLSTLKGKRLGCFCKPKSCHGDIIAELVNNLENNVF